MDSLNSTSKNLDHRTGFDIIPPAEESYKLSLRSNIESNTVTNIDGNKEVNNYYFNKIKNLIQCNSSLGSYHTNCLINLPLPNSFKIENINNILMNLGYKVDLTFTLNYINLKISWQHQH